MVHLNEMKRKILCGSFSNLDLRLDWYGDYIAKSNSQQEYTKV